MNLKQKLGLFIPLGLFIFGLYLSVIDSGLSGYILSIAVFLLAIGVRSFNQLKGSTFTLSIISIVILSLHHPEYFLSIGNFELKVLMVPLLQIIMFGMGTTISINDFKEVVKSPKSVIIGVICQFTIMPIVGLTITFLFDLPSEIAAGIILIGSSPSGLSSNVMAYLAKANLALSVTLTTIATLIAPIMTPLLMKLLAGQYVPIDFWNMMWGITKIVLIPVIAGVIFNKILHGKSVAINKVMPIISMLAVIFIIAIIIAMGRDNLMEVGVVLFVACIIHNIAGYTIGYQSAKLLKMDEQSARTVALEVGLQNGGLASGIALQMGKAATLGLAPAIFGVVMNVTGSALANWWKEKPINQEVE